MPRTNTNRLRTEVKESVKKDNNIKLDITPENLHAYLDRDKLCPYEMLKGLPRRDMAKAIEYIFLLREIYGAGGFERQVSNYNIELDHAWEQIESSGMKELFRGKGEGFVADWLNDELFHKLNKATAEQWAQWLTYFDTSSAYRYEILKAKYHRAMLATTYDENVLNWLKGI